MCAEFNSDNSSKRHSQRYHGSSVFGRAHEAGQEENAERPRALHGGECFAFHARHRRCAQTNLYFWLNAFCSRSSQQCLSRCTARACMPSHPDQRHVYTVTGTTPWRWIIIIGLVLSQFGLGSFVCSPEMLSTSCPDAQARGHSLAKGTAIKCHSWCSAHA